MNDMDLIKMHDDINTLHAAVVDLTAAVNTIQTQARFNAEEVQRHAAELTSLSDIAHGNSVTVDDLRNDINGVNHELGVVRDDLADLDRRVRTS